MKSTSQLSGILISSGPPPLFLLQMKFNQKRKESLSQRKQQKERKKNQQSLQIKIKTEWGTNKCLIKGLNKQNLLIQTPLIQMVSFDFQSICLKSQPPQIKQFSLQSQNKNFNIISVQQSHIRKL
ncbi:hypothetical protein TTHERM_00624510 (macronuclear) [Tetrahymena thermophila SB210]|uniref:Uncharacterized protein n=1 Tax=Tetrahymena thermophila (strain SB210) TaxID=312017 RepID=Q240T2_TETTS|nr:hypothetical protein TTHERM_00624510 [Tetrahymena thermophila SB210]EAS02332.1 hypothetical protein TTHERM_00624510 [Tetrahymena thermophila SB210]|eukprot:XP_001022577.1 hypothetical protein TTHERM_00624510 [Tetrahymena thermophila SB210]